MDISNELIKQKDAAIGNLTAVRDHLEGTVRNQLAEAVAERDRLNQEVKRLLEANRRHVAQRDRVNHEMKQALDEKGHQIVQLTEERDRVAQELNCFQAVAEVQAQELASIKDTLGWRGLEKYRKVREESKVIKFLHSFFTQPVKRLSKKNLTLPMNRPI